MLQDQKVFPETPNQPLLPRVLLQASNLGNSVCRSNFADTASSFPIMSHVHRQARAIRICGTHKRSKMYVFSTGNIQKMTSTYTRTAKIRHSNNRRCGVTHKVPSVTVLSPSPPLSVPTGIGEDVCRLPPVITSC